eukprot:CAMPEP_0181325614 /NCGR_PEP_ID=MMETSP1101-20121128/21030_1 /TAXON_ID=46948 /ORGANISM="Rhodomonas abbreviata, Strain Caron Lab Isolate" /LENGTH=305 /DNA_ID=CAMNT_0023433955 /DNA_START=652 /DNA_END=1567 /DNA_ORIENTATION=+
MTASLCASQPPGSSGGSLLRTARNSRRTAKENRIVHMCTALTASSHPLICSSNERSQTESTPASAPDSRAIAPSAAGGSTVFGSAAQPDAEARAVGCVMDQLPDAGKLENWMLDVQHEQSMLGNHITMVLPAWVQVLHNVLPPSAYTPWLRRAIENLVVCWMSVSFLWALWQLYHHLELFAAAVRPVVRLMMALFGKILRRVDDVLDSWTAKYIHWMKPLDVVVLRIRASGLLTTPLFRSISSFLQSLRHSIATIPVPPAAGQLAARLSAAWAGMYVPLPTWMYQTTKQVVTTTEATFAPLLSSA